MVENLEKVKRVILEGMATKSELDALLNQFEAECIRGDAGRIQHAHDACSGALERHLDALSGKIAVVKNTVGL